ncbi:MAG TPA: hypothetical protein VJA21_27695 [Verrucomicrobiae bacterium]
MQISRCLVVLCAALCALSVRGDNEAQKKAREALDKLSGLPSQATAAPAVPVAPQAPKVAPAKIAEPAPVRVATPPTAPAADADAIAKAREALRQKMQTIGGQGTAVTPPAQPVSPTPPPPVAVPATPVAAPAPAVVAQPAAPPPVVAVPAASSDALSKAREAMRVKMQDVIRQEPADVWPAPPAPAVQATTPAPAAPPAVASTAPAPAVTPPPVAVTAQTPVAAEADPAAVAKAREALRLKMQELTGQGAAQGFSGLPAGTTPPAAGDTALTTQPSADEETIAKAREAMRLRLRGVAQASGAQPSSYDSGRKAQLSGSGARLDFPPLEGPPLPISLEKQNKLADLLQRYKADEISPEEYHAQRAKILSGK